MNLSSEEIQRLQHLLLRKEVESVELAMSMLKGNEELIDELYWTLLLLSALGVVPGSRIDAQILLKQDKYAGRYKFDQRCLLIFQQNFKIRSKKENQNFLDYFHRIRLEVEPLLLSAPHYADYFGRAAQHLNPDFESLRPEIDRFYQLNILGNPNHGAIHFEYAEFLIQYDDPFSTSRIPLEHYERSAELGHQSNEAYFKAGVYAHKRLQEFDLAKDYYLKSQKAPNYTYEVYFNLAILEMDQYQDYKKAAHFFEACLRKKPQSVEVLNNLAWLYAFHLSDFELAEQYNEKALILNAEHPPTLDSKAWISWKFRQDHQLAETYFKKTLSIQKDYWPACKHLCEMLIENDKTEAAKAYFIHFIQQLSPQQREQPEISNFFTYFR